MRIITRAEWGARYGLGPLLDTYPRDEVVGHTEAGAIRPADWNDLLSLPDLGLDEAAHTRAVERFHAVTRGWPGIAYSFFIHFDGTIVEGQGWRHRGTHTEQGLNYTAYGICFRGHGDLQAPTEAQWAAFRWLIGEGIRLGYIAPNPTISSHHQYSLKGKTCAGLKVRPHLQARLAGIVGPVPYDPFPENDMPLRAIKTGPTSRRWALVGNSLLDITARTDYERAIAFGLVEEGPAHIWPLGWFNAVNFGGKFAELVNDEARLTEVIRQAVATSTSVEVPINPLAEAVRKELHRALES